MVESVQGVRRPAPPTHWSAGSKGGAAMFETIVEP
jgi:hypothetical protein